MINKISLTVIEECTENGLITCLGLGFYNPCFKIGGTMHIRPPYLEELHYWFSRIPREVKEDSIAIVTGVSFPLDGNPDINEKSSRCQMLARYHIRNFLIKSGIESTRIVNEFSLPNTVTSLTLDPRNGIAHLRRTDPFKPSEEYVSLRLDYAEGVYIA